MLAFYINNTHLKRINYKHHLETLPLKRQHRLLSYKFERDLLASLAGDLLLDFSLKELYGIAKRPLLSYNEYDKPYFANSNIHFNISHSGDYTICAIGNTPVGIDIQKMDIANEKHLLLIAKRFFSHSETNMLNEANDRIDLFYSLWCLKESYVKYTGKGLHTPLNTFSFSFENTISVVDFLSHDNNCSDLSFSLTSIDKDYKVAVCTKDQSVLIQEINASMII